MVFTLKPDPGRASGRVKARVVVCGNFVEGDDYGASDLFAGGATAVALRIVVAASSQRKWRGLTLDVKTAFLNAPMHQGKRLEDQEAKTQKRVIVRPPNLLVSLGLVKPDSFWEAVKAMYGYRQSPRLWSDFRDDEVRSLTVMVDDGVLSLEQMLSEPNLWKIWLTPKDLKLEPRWVGILLVYVDDFLLTGEDVVLTELTAAICRKWETSTPEEVDETKGTRFLGTELWRDRQGRWLMTQENYTADLLGRKMVEPPDEWKTRKTPIVKGLDDHLEDDGEPDESGRDPGMIKKAQQAVGELVSMMITRSPQRVMQLADHVWKYLAGSMHYGLAFEDQEDPGELNIFTDAAFGDMPHGCVLVQWGSAALLWKSSRQTVATASTAESELVEVLEGAVAGEAVRAVVEELIGARIRSCIHTDSSSALAIVTNESGSWRTRHLRKRAFHLRTRVIAGDWLMRHVPGSEMPADLGTKALGCDRFETLRKLIGMKKRETNQAEMAEKHAVSKPQLQQALKMIILATRVFMAKGAVEDEKHAVRAEVMMMWSVNPTHGWMMLSVIGALIMMGVLWSVRVGMKWCRQKMISTTPSASLMKDETSPSRQSNLSGISAALGESMNPGPRAAGGPCEDGPSSSSQVPNLRSQESSARPHSSGVVIVSGAGTHVRFFYRTLFITPKGTKYHARRDCHGLRNAQRIFETDTCEDCAQLPYRPQVRLWSKGWGADLHTCQHHAAEEVGAGEVRSYEPCLLCLSPVGD
eukprot:Skav205036  [mRNA]  locus=scaffold2669:138044:140299:- [translate_table: standard]